MKIKQLNSTGSKTVSLIGKNNQGEAIFTKDIVLNVVASNSLECTVGVQGEDLNVFLIGDNIVQNKDQLIVYMFTNKQTYSGISPIIETPNLLKYSNLDGDTSPNANLTYKVVAGYDISEQQAKEEAKAIPDNNQNCKTISIGNPCIVCFTGNNQS